VYCIVFEHWAKKILKIAEDEESKIYIPFLLRLGHLKALGDTNQAFQISETGIIDKFYSRFVEKDKVL
jgi:hypothetical protein